MPVVAKPEDLRGWQVRLDARLLLHRKLAGRSFRPKDGAREHRERPLRRALRGRLPSPPCRRRRRAAGVRHRRAVATPSWTAGLGIACALDVRHGAKLGDLAVRERGHRTAGHMIAARSVDRQLGACPLVACLEKGLVSSAKPFSSTSCMDFRQPSTAVLLDESNATIKTKKSFRYRRLQLAVRPYT